MKTKKILQAIMAHEALHAIIADLIYRTPVTWCKVYDMKDCNGMEITVYGDNFANPADYLVIDNTGLTATGSSIDFALKVLRTKRTANR